MIVGTIVARGSVGIGDTIGSLFPFVDRVVVLGIQSAEATSAKAYLAAGEAPLTWIEETEELSEVDGRNGALTLCRQDDWALSLDPGERLLGDRQSMGELRKWVLKGKIEEALGLSVYVPGELVKIEPRLFPIRNHQYRDYGEGIGLYAKGKAVGPGTLTGEIFIVVEP